MPKLPPEGRPGEGLRGDAYATFNNNNNNNDNDNGNNNNNKYIYICV